LEKQKKIITILISTAVFFTAASLLLLYSPRFQTLIVKKIVERFSHNHHFYCSVESVNFSFFKNFQLHNFIVRDLKNDTLAFFKTIEIDCDSLNFEKSGFFLSQIKLNNAVIKTNIDSLNVSNFDFLKKLFPVPENSKSDTLNSDLCIFCKKIVWTNLRFEYQKYTKGNHLIPEKNILNPHDLQISKCNNLIENFKFKNNTTDFKISNLSFTEKCGLFTKYISCEVNINKYFFNVFALNYKGISSFFSFDTLSICYLKNKIYNTGGELLGFYGNLSTNDLIFVSPLILNSQKNFNFALNLSWSDNRIDIRKIYLSQRRSFSLKGNISLFNYKNLDSLAVVSEITKLKTSLSGVLKIPIKNVNKIVIEKLQNSTDFDSVFLSGKILASQKTLNFNGQISAKNQNFNCNLKLETDTMFHKISAILLINSRYFDVKKFNSKMLISGAEIESKTNLIIENGKLSKFENFSNFRKIDLFNFGISNLSIETKMENDIWTFNTSTTDSIINFKGNSEVCLSGKIPSFSFNADFNNIKIYLKNQDSIIEIKGRVEGFFQGTGIDDFTGNLGISDGIFKTENDSIVLKSLIFTSENSDRERILKLESDYLDADIRGNFRFSDMMHASHKFISVYLPSFVIIEDTVNENDYKSRIINVTADLKNPDKINKLFLKNFEFSDSTHFEAFFRTNDAKLDLYLHIPHLRTNFLNVKNLNVKSITENKNLFVNLDCQFALSDTSEASNNLIYSGRIKNDSILSLLSWTSNDSLNLNGNFSAETHFVKTKNDNSVIVSTEILPTEINIGDSVWNFSGNSIKFNRDKINIQNLKLQNNSQSIDIAGIIGENRKDELRVNFENLRLSEFINPIKSEYFKINGIVNGTLNIGSILKRPNYTFIGSLQNCKINNSDFGTLSIITENDTVNKRLNIFVNSKSTENQVTMEGYYFNNDDNLTINGYVNHLDLKTSQVFLNNQTKIKQGKATGNFQISGKTDNLHWSGTLNVQDALIHENETGTDFRFSTLIALDNNQILISKTDVVDQLNDSAHFSAEATHNNFENIKFNLHFDTNKFLVLNTQKNDSSNYYGKLLASGSADITGDLNEMTINSEFSTLPSSEIFINNQSNDIEDNNDFVQFKSEVLKKKIEKPLESTNLHLDISLNLSPETKLHIVTNSATNDQIVAQGIGNMHFKTDDFGKPAVSGNYEIQKGNFNFTVERLYGKKFEIQSGSKIQWYGDPLNPMMSITSLYKLRKVKLYDLTLDETEKQKEIPVNCFIYMTESLLHPKIKFGIETKDNDKNISSMLNNLQEDEMNKQFLSLLLLNRFLPLPGLVKQTSQGENNSLSAAEIFSGHVGSELSILKHNLDVGINYRQNASKKSNEIEVDFSTGLLNDRVEINGNIASGEFQNSTGNIVGDFDAEVKISHDGKLKLKAFNMSNRYLTYESGPYTQGVGLFFRTEFDKIFKKKKTKDKSIKTKNKKSSKSVSN
jgi:hypothetical protein